MLKRNPKNSWIPTWAAFRHLFQNDILSLKYLIELLMSKNDIFLSKCLDITQSIVTMKNNCLFLTLLMVKILNRNFKFRFTLTTLPHLWSPSKDMTIMLFEHLHFYLSLDFWLHVYAITAWWQTFSLILSNHPAVSSSPFLKFFFHIMNKSQWGIFTSRDTVTLAVMEIGSEKERPLERARSCTPSSNI